MEHTDLIDRLLLIEHHNIAVKLRLIEEDSICLTDELLIETIELLDDLSLNTSQEAKKTIILLAAILWTYKDEKWTGLRDFLIKVLSRIGFSPSSIMLDSGYDPSTKMFSAMQSYLDELAVTVHQLRNEILVNEKKYLLTDFQFRIWQSISANKVLGISAPTSAGKSFIIALKTIDLLLEKPGQVVYIVPTLSLVNQVTVDYRNLLRAHEQNDYQILNTFAEDNSLGKVIYVLTQEKAIAAFSQSKVPFQNIRLIVIDEIQNVEKVSNEDDQRAKTLYDLIVEFRNNCSPDHIIISGPRIEKIGKLGKDLFGQDTKEEEALSSPVGSITYSILKRGKKSFFKQYSGITKKPFELEITTGLNMPAGAYYKKEVHDFIANLTFNLGANSKNIIFSPNPDQANKTALFIAENILHLESDVKIDSLANYLSDTVHPNYDLILILKSRVAYHHGKMPHHVRRVVERAISEKIVNNVVCTTTLMQGVNLPAQNVIIRNPNLFLKKSKDDTNPPKLTDYEIANLRGRAGRLMKDFLGRTFILEEEKFEGAAEDDRNLFGDVRKELKSGYGETFTKYRGQIVSDLASKKLAATENQEYAFLTTYIRQAAIKNPDGLMKKLSTVGIDLTQGETQQVIATISNLSVPDSVCLENRYWDPLILNDLYLISSQFVLPTSIDEPQLAHSLVKIIERLQDVVPFYAAKYFSIKNSAEIKRLDSICYLAESWIKEKPLSTILKNPYYDNPVKINDVIASLQNQISYNLPRLLQPLYDMQLPNSSFLRFLELGAYHPVTRKLIEHSIPRETAIFLKNRYLSQINFSSGDFETQVLRKLKENYPQMDYWVQIQLEVLL